MKSLGITLLALAIVLCVGTTYVRAADAGKSFQDILSGFGTTLECTQALRAANCAEDDKDCQTKVYCTNEKCEPIKKSAVEKGDLKCGAPTITISVTLLAASTWIARAFIGIY